ncbi:helix-turn-helix domain-containing protein [Cellulomonas sp. DKR-3]|uniref:Helix-turn-helix domain-containing protein n=1 Tax=Cellulomonas fulva TaxID=2835530 RepID=A0ABS5TXN5_9CELL|nr:helix-turn-helix domain-containing protein [Cellulomonas fulva]MBT0993918.1 helix-turn-helix domain-containing protein [Cellulomonas fulva]
MSTKTAQKAAGRPTVHRARIPADAIAVLVVQTLVLAGVWLTAIVVSFTGLVAAAGWANVAGLPSFGVPLFIDGILVGASLAYLVARERHDRASQWIAVLAMLAFCGLSITGNATHALGSSAAGMERITGILLAVAAPVAILVTTELLARTVIASPDEHVPAPASRAARRAARPATVTAPAALPTTAPAPTTQPAQRPAQWDETARPKRSSYSQEQRAEAVRLAAEGLSQRQIAEAVGATKSAVQSWLAAGVPAGQPVGANT